MTKKRRKAPYKVGTVEIDGLNGKKYKLTAALTPKGDYIGAPKEAAHLWRKFGIQRFEKRKKTSSVCSVGYSPRRKLWYGWSHRAIRGFKTRAEAARFAESVS